MFFRNPAINSKIAIDNNLNDISEIDVQIGEPENLITMSEEDQHDSLLKTDKSKIKNNDKSSKGRTDKSDIL
jgi:hypothetical protein